MSQHSNLGKKYIVPNKVDIASSSFCEKVREKLKLTKKELTDSQIKNLCTLNNKLILDWVVNNADGFFIKDNGAMVVSKFLPKYLRGDKELTIEAIRNNPKHDEKRKIKLIKRYEKGIEDYKKWGEKGRFNLNPHSFFYMYRGVWFNKGNCDFDKASLYTFVQTENLKDAINNAVIKEGKDYYEWVFSDFRFSKRRKKEERANEKQRAKSKKTKLKEFLEKRQNGNSVS